MFKTYLVILISFALLGFEIASAQQNLVLGEPSFTGKGCPPGSVSAALSPDNSALSVLFDRFTVDKSMNGKGALRGASSSCSVSLPIAVPSGYQVTIVRLDYRGFVNITARDVWLDVNTRSIAVETLRQRSKSPPLMSTRLRGPISQDFTVTHPLNNGQIRSTCGQPFNLNFTSELLLFSNCRGKGCAIVLDGEASATIDSLDASGSMDFGYVLTPCS
jgi:hypothetical protein